MLSRSASVIAKASVGRVFFSSAPFLLPPLPYPHNALSPYISEATMKCHHDSHHATYVNNLNNATKDQDRKPLSYYINSTTGFTHNQAAQIWNHSFFWNCMAPKGSELPHGKLEEAMNRDFGSFSAFKDQFSKVAIAHFGSGWAWLVHDPATNKLKIISTKNEGNPMSENLRPLLTCDVWEHAYYLDYQSRRAEFVKQWWSIVNWKYVDEVYNSDTIPVF